MCIIIIVVCIQKPDLQLCVFAALALAEMPRVVADQKNKYETDELFKKLSQDVDVSSAAGRPPALAHGQGQSQSQSVLV